MAKAKEKREADAAQRIIDDRIRRQVYARDLGLCRACGKCVELHHANELKLAHVHHVVYRSAGGDSRLSNLIILCPYCHDLEHRHLIDITGTASKLSVRRLIP